MKHDPVIRIEGAREHNLKDLTLSIPRDQLVVICGPSGSGKSTLAFDLIYAEGQRRYVESLSAYARQFLPQLDKPKVDKIEGLSPAISIEQHAASKNPRSTVGTVTEIYDFLRVFFARLGTPHCPVCDSPISAQTADQIIEDIMARPEGSRFLVCARLVENLKGTHKDLLDTLRKAGFGRVIVDGTPASLEAVPPLAKTTKHTIDLVVDRLTLRPGIRSRLADSVETALTWGEGALRIEEPEGDSILYSTSAVCTEHRISLPSPSPQLFSFNSPQGSCRRCYGLGSVSFYDPELYAPDHGLSIDAGAIQPLQGPLMRAFRSALVQLGKRWGFTLSTPLNRFPAQALEALFHGDGSASWPGMTKLLERGEKLGQAFYEKLGMYRQNTPCPACEGTRLRPEALAVKIDGINIHQFTSLPIEDALLWVTSRQYSGPKAIIADPLLKELTHRLRFLHRVGLDYLSLSREMATVSGGESQRIRLASQLGTGLVGVTYVLDEPTIGLHQKDNLRLLDTLRELQARGNTVLVVEHDEQTILTADHVIELGPGSGRLGGEIVFEGAVSRLLRSADSLTARYLRRELSAPRPEGRRAGEGAITLVGATTHNLKSLSCRFPLKALTCVTGVSGSGKSSLVMDTLYRHLARAKGIKAGTPGPVNQITGAEAIEKIIVIDQSPIGRTPRSNPATYTKIFDDIRGIFAGLPEARVRGYDKGRFSFNVKGGRCEACGGDGEIKVEMHFLPDVSVTCDICRGRRYNRETLEITYRDRTIADVLTMTVLEALEFFSAYPALKRRLEVLREVGLEYLQLGQPATTLSGGEAQRIKISRELGKRSLPGTIYILDEPTTGLHMHEVGKLIEVLHSLVRKKATVVLIEHNLDVIAASDYIIDLGPGGGHNGGNILAQGTPEEIAAHPDSITGAFLKQAVDVIL